MKDLGEHKMYGHTPLLNITSRSKYEHEQKGFKNYTEMYDFWRSEQVKEKLVILEDDGTFTVIYNKEGK